MAVLIVTAVIATIIVFVPIGLIWAINTLFGTAIAVTFKTWFAAFVLISLVNLGGGSK